MGTIAHRTHTRRSRHTRYNNTHTPTHTHTALNGMPPCPISGRPMVHPVVAADGHTYEKSSIARWMLNNDASPTTGELMKHQVLVPNYLLLSTFQERRTEIRPPASSSSGAIGSSPASSASVGRSD